MPCSDSSSSISFKIDHDERLLSFTYAKITCGSEISGGTGLNDYLKGKPLAEILQTSFNGIQQDLKLANEEAQFILYMEWDALRSAIAQYLGVDSPDIDKDRCFITSIDHGDEAIEVAEVILPPKELPKILPCSLSERNKKDQNI